jgi:hypothetical protein
MAPVKSPDTRRPTSPDFTMLERTRSNISSDAAKSDGMTLPPAKPSSTISTNRTFGVKIERTLARSTPGMKNTWLVISSKSSKNSGVNMSPSRDTRATSTRLAPPNSSSYFRKVCMYSCLSGSCFLKPVSILSCDIANSMPIVMTTKIDTIA